MGTLAIPTSKDSSVSSHTRNNFDFLRFLFAALVIFSHSYILTFVRWNEPLSVISRHQAVFGEYAVDSFFVISGFLITASWQRSETFFDFLIKRVLRIYPGFIAATIMCALVFAPLGADNAGAYFHQIHTLAIIKQALTLDKPGTIASFQHLPLAGVIDGSMWTIRIEFECYLLTAACGLLGLLKRRNLILGLFLVATLLVGAINLAPPNVHHLTESVRSHSRFVLYYLSGMTCLLYKEKVKYSPAYLAAAILAFVVLTYTHALLAFSNIPLTYCMMYVAFLPIPHLNKFAKYFDASYGMYLYAWPIQQLCVYYSGKSLNPLELFAIAAPLTCLCAIASWFLIEKPFLKMKPKKSHAVPVAGEEVLAPAAAEANKPEESKIQITQDAVTTDGV